MKTCLLQLSSAAWPHLAASETKRQTAMMSTPSPRFALEFKAVTGSHPRAFRGSFSRWVLTRLHTRYNQATLSEDLVFQPAKAVTGGRGSAGQSVEPPGQVVKNSQTNQFQGRYILRNYWQGPVQCKNPVFDSWGGPPRGATKPGVQAATKTAWSKRGSLRLSEEVRSAVPRLDLPGKARKRRP